VRAVHALALDANPRAEPAQLARDQLGRG